MNRLFRKLTVVAGAVAFSAVVAPVRAQGVAVLPSGEDPKLRELLCRGGPAGLKFEVVNDPENPTLPGYVRMKLSFVPHLTRPPGSCHWLDRSDNPSPPVGQVFFDILARAEEAEGVEKDTTVNAALGYVDTASIRRYMSVANHFWIFYQMHPSQENFAEVHAAADPEVLGITVAPSRATSVGTAVTAAAQSRKSDPVKVTSVPLPSGTKRAIGDRGVPLPRSPLTLVAVSPAGSRFKIKFTARPNASPVVLYWSERPVKDATGSWVFPVGGTRYIPGVGTVLAGTGLIGGLPQAAVRESAITRTKSQYTAASTVPLENGKIYYFIVTVPGGSDLPEEQITGRLTAAQ